jgi:integrative and conjugative element protein (TIGR02256 family)
VTIWLSKEVADEMHCQGRRWAPLETGGVLLGWRDGDDRIVAGLIGAGDKAVHAVHAFEPDHEFQIEELGKVFARTNGDLDYLGDWHTHPAGHVAMSWRDRRTLRAIGRTVGDALMVIVEPGPDCAVIGGWRHFVERSYFRRIGRVDIVCFSAPDDWPCHLPS